MNDELTALILDAAAQEICDQGLHKGNFFSPDVSHEGGVACQGPACALGAIWRARYLLDDDREYTGSLYGDPATLALGKVLPIQWDEYVPSWNDAEERTAEEVSDAMLEAAARLRTGGPRKR